MRAAGCERRSSTVDCCNFNKLNDAYNQLGTAKLQAWVAPRMPMPLPANPLSRSM